MAVNCFAFLATSALMVVLMTLHTTEGTITCYHCSGSSGELLPSTTFQNCGLPFKDNTTNQFTLLPTTTCEGVCVTNTIFTAGNVPSTRFYRSCSDAPITDGCEYYAATGYQQWSCIKTCKTDKCNTGSDSTMLTPPTVVQLLVLATAGVVSRFALF